MFQEKNEGGLKFLPNWNTAVLKILVDIYLQTTNNNFELGKLKLYYRHKKLPLNYLEKQ